MVYYTVYKITNKINNKFYIGKHKTQNLNDGYMGSGKLIKAAILKYGIENFTKEILFVFDNEQEMNVTEEQLVTIAENSYNLCPGGQGGFGFINTNKLNQAANNKRKGNPGRKLTPEQKKAISERAKRNHALGILKPISAYKQICDGDNNGNWCKSSNPQQDLG